MKKLVTAFVMFMVSFGVIAGDLSGNHYGRGNALQVSEVYLGTVIQARPVTLAATEPMDRYAGAAAGAALGGLLAQNVGQGKGRIAAGIVGAMLGGYAGDAIAKGMTTREGIEVVVKFDNGRTLAIVQEADTAFAPGQRVMLVAGQGQARVVPAAPVADTTNM